MDVQFSKTKLLLLRWLKEDFESAEKIIHDVIEEQVIQLAHETTPELKKLRPTDDHNAFYTTLKRMYKEEGLLGREQGESLSYKIKNKYAPMVSFAKKLPILQIIKNTKRTIEPLDIQILSFCKEGSKLDYVITAKFTINPRYFPKRSKKLIDLGLLDELEADSGHRFFVTQVGEELTDVLYGIEAIDSEVEEFPKEKT